MANTNKKITIWYWVVNVLFAGFMIFTAIPDVANNADAVKMIHSDMGYPLYFLLFIGVAKILGGIAVLIPGFPRIKEWAYAGLTFDLIAATYSFAAMGKPAAEWAPMFIFIAVAFIAYALYHKKYKTTAIA